MHLESGRLAPGTINLRLGAVRHLAYEAADCLAPTWQPEFGGCKQKIRDAVNDHIGFEPANS
jgi:hypothetical protein